MAMTLALISRLLGRVLANLSLALVRDGLANVFSQIVAIFAAILTVIPGARHWPRGSKRPETNQQH